MAVETTSPSRSARKSTTSKSTGSQRTSAAALIDPERRRALICEAAYFRAERRGFEPGHEMADWLAAEIEIDTTLTVGVSPSRNAAMHN